MKTDFKIKSFVSYILRQKCRQRNANNHSTTEHVKLRWLGLFFISVITFILLSNSHYIRLQSEAIATENIAAISPELQPLHEALTNDKQTAPNQLTTTELELDSENSSTFPDEQTLAINTLSINSITPNTHDNTDPNTKYSWVVRSGDTLSEILSRFDVYSSLGSILGLGRQAKPLLYLRAGKRMDLDINDGVLEKITYHISQTEHFILKQSADGKVSTENYILPIEKREAFAAGFIEDSFYHAGLRAGLTDELIIEAAYILGWDIDFVLDIRSGDFFSMLYEEEFLDGIKIGNSDILGIELINRGKTYRAIRHTDTDGTVGYFYPDGRNVKKPFLRTPVDFTRISSKFDPKRLHPILNTIRPHQGIDYAAYSGTPIYATAKGRVIFRGWKAGYGNVVLLRHHGAYTTLYAHMSNFAKGIRSGSSVEQRQTIGYVGKTGYATGPHLHYEFRINDIHKNPLTVALPDSQPLAQSKLAAFQRSIEPTLAKIRTISRSYATAK